MRNKQGFVPLRACLLFGLLTALVWGGQMPGSAQATPPAPKILQRPCEQHWQNASLEEITHELQAQFHLNLIVDGEPVRKSADLDVAGSLADALDKVADAFDYRWKTLPGNIVVMNKGFTNPYERPQLDLPEMRQMALEIQQTLNSLPPDAEGSQVTLLNQLRNQFTPEQKAMLTSGQHLHARDLDAGQFSLFTQAITCAVYSEPIKTAREFVAWMELLPLSSLSAKAMGAVTPEGKPRADIFLSARDRNDRVWFKPIGFYTLIGNSKVK